PLRANETSGGDRRGALAYRLFRTASLPKALLLPPAVLTSNAFKPTAVLSVPQILLKSALLPVSHAQPAALSLSPMISQYFTGGMMPDRAIPVQLHANDPGADRHGIPLAEKRRMGRL